MSEEIFSRDRFRLDKRVNLKFNKGYVKLRHYGGLAPTNFRIADRRRDSEQFRSMVWLLNCPNTPF